MISRKVKENVFTLDENADIDFDSLEQQFSELRVQLDMNLQDVNHMETVKPEYRLDEKQS